MAAKIFNPPSSLKQPNLSLGGGNVKDGISDYRKNCDKYMEDLKAILVKNAELKKQPTKNVGEVVKFPVADSYAMYMVASMKPLQLVHIPLWDAWNYQYIERLTAKDIQQEIDNAKALEKLFKK